MALIIRGKTLCHICGRVLAEDDKVQLFPPALVAPTSAAAHLTTPAFTSPVSRHSQSTTKLPRHCSPIWRVSSEEAALDVGGCPVRAAHACA